ncbi:hypothetical protein MP228_000459 [Amoeboaphelidium protococcarum]|nr:hypothetical protein MP228_000459 [Amoeboaphelidium protococcarum]
MKQNGVPLVKMYFDVLSPYTYIAFTIIARYHSLQIWTNRQVQFEFVPVYLSGVMKLAENRPPATVPLKGQYMFKDLKRLGRMNDIPIKVMPSVFPTNTLGAMRLLTVLKEKESVEVYLKAANKLFISYWAEDIDIGGDFSKLLKDIIPSDRLNNYMELSRTQEYKDKLNQETTEAVQSYGMFGAPYFVVISPADKNRVEAFFGSDRIESLAQYLNLPYHGFNPSKVNLKQKL